MKLLSVFGASVAFTMGLGLAVNLWAQDLEKGVSKRLAIRRAAELQNVEYDFELKLVEEGPISATVVVGFDLTRSSRSIVLDFSPAADKLKKFEVNGAAAEPRVGQEHIQFAGTLFQEGRNEIRIEFEAGEQSLNRNPDFLYTLLVPDRARTLFPCFDQPDLKAKFKLKLSLPYAWTASANGPVIQEREDRERGWRSIEYGQTKPISTYLFAFAAGKFERVERKIHGRTVSLLHRESDEEKVARNLDDIFALHELSLEWMEQYTDIEYPFEKFDFVLIPSFQYGGMEHIGNIFYNADQLFLDKSATKNQKLNRASLIAHETAHMWFGNLVTMKWFDDVWLKEVFANFMAAKIVHPSFPDIDHNLGFLMKHHPSAYNEDRTEGTYPIQQKLDNLNNAGTLYGRIIYMKAPIVMRQLETLIGPRQLQQGLREYLTRFSYKNAVWDDLIQILDKKTKTDLGEWSSIWVKAGGVPETGSDKTGQTDDDVQFITSSNRTADGRSWLQQLDACISREGKIEKRRIQSGESLAVKPGYDFVLISGSELGYGYFKLDSKSLRFLKTHVHEVQDPLVRGAAYLQLFETMLREGKVKNEAGVQVPAKLTPQVYMETLLVGLREETEPLNRQNLLSQAQTVYWKFLSPSERAGFAQRLESHLWKWVEDGWEGREPCSEDAKSAYYKTLVRVAQTSQSIERLLNYLENQTAPTGVILAEADYMNLAYELALRLPEQADAILNSQLARIQNEDRKRKFSFVSPALSPAQAVRDQFFETLKEPGNRRPERWALDGLHYLHHPLRAASSEKYLLPSLELLEEIQSTGDIFFPKRWLVETFSGHRSSAAARTVRDFLKSRPDYSPNLRNKILQAADLLFRVAE